MFAGNVQHCDTLNTSSALQAATLLLYGRTAIIPYYRYYRGAFGIAHVVGPVVQHSTERAPASGSRRRDRISWVT